MSKVNFFAQGLGLKPLSADPTSPTDGQLYMSDGTVRAAGLWRYSASSVAWLAVGSGGGGLDVFHTEDFESNGASDFTTGNAATVDAAGTGTLDGALADEESSQFAGDRSLKYTMGSTSANDFFLQDADIPVELKQTANDIGVSFYFKYNGDDDDIRFFALDQDDNELTSSIEYIKAASTPTRFSTSFFIPTGTTGIRYGFQVVTGNSGKILIVDDFELSTNPFVYKNLVEMTDWESYTPTTQGLGTPTITIAQWRRVGDSMEILGKFTTGTVTASEAQFNLPSGYTINSSILSEVSIVGELQRKVASSTADTMVLATGGDTFLNFCRVDGTYDGLTPETGSNTFGSTEVESFHAKVPIEGWSASSEHVVSPAKSNMNDVEFYTPASVQGFTLGTESLRYSRLGEYLIIEGRFAYSSPTASEMRVDLPVINGSTLIAASNYDSIERVGEVLSTNTTTTDAFVLIGASDTYMTFGVQNGSSTPLAKGLGNAILNSAETLSIKAMIRIEGWSSDATFLAAIPVQKVAFFKEVQTSGTTSGTFTNGAWRDRTLNVHEGNTDFVSLSANVITLQAGTYIIKANAPAYNVDNHKIKLLNTTDTTDDIIGGNASCIAGSYSGSDAKLEGEITISSAKSFKIQHRCTTTQATNGFGPTTTFGVDEVFTQVKITKLR